MTPRQNRVLNKISTRLERNGHDPIGNQERVAAIAAYNRLSNKADNQAVTIGLATLAILLSATVASFTAFAQSSSAAVIETQISTELQTDVKVELSSTGCELSDPVINIHQDSAKTKAEDAFGLAATESDAQASNRTDSSGSSPQTGSSARWLLHISLLIMIAVSFIANLAIMINRGRVIPLVASEVVLARSTSSEQMTVLTALNELVRLSKSQQSLGVEQNNELSSSLRNIAVMIGRTNSTSNTQSKGAITQVIQTVEIGKPSRSRRDLIVSVTRSSRSKKR